MKNSDLALKEWSQHDEEVWNAWLNRNGSKDKAQFVKAAKFAGIAAMVRNGSRNLNAFNRTSVSKSFIGKYGTRTGSSFQGS